MKLACFKIVTAALILIAILHVCHCAPPKPQGRSLADNYTALNEDVKWFFRGVSKIASTVDQMLPNATTDLAKTRTFSENTRITLLNGLHHLLVGVREIAMTFEKSFNTDHVKQLYQLKNVTSFANDLINTLKMWFSQIRAIVMHILLIYNSYMPEVLFGKCLGNYLVTTYPERSFYEYPFILLSELYFSILTKLQAEPTETAELTILPILDPDLNMQQNEISNSDLEDIKTSYETKSTPQIAQNSMESSYSFNSFFDLSSVLNPNKDKIIEDAANEHSWQVCFKLYTAESISRALKLYFLAL